jgi:hypothetical protein
VDGGESRFYVEEPEAQPIRALETPTALHVPFQRSLATFQHTFHPIETEPSHALQNQLAVNSVALGTHFLTPFLVFHVVRARKEEYGMRTRTSCEAGGRCSSLAGFCTLLFRLPLVIILDLLILEIIIASANCFRLTQLRLELVPSFTEPPHQLGISSLYIPTSTIAIIYIRIVSLYYYFL